MDLLSIILEDSSTKAYLSEYPRSEWITAIKRVLKYGIHSLKALEYAGFPLPVPSEPTHRSMSTRRSSKNTPTERHRRSSKNRSKLDQSVKIQRKHRCRRSNNKENKEADFGSPEVRKTAEFISNQPFEVKNLLNMLPDDIPRRLKPVELRLETDYKASSHQ